MNHTTHHIHTDEQHEAVSHGSLTSYVLGFILSIGCTFAAFYAATFSYQLAIGCIVAAALVQLFIQMVFFLHIGKRGTPGAHQLIFWFTLLIVAIVVGGTLWIMTNLAHLHMHAAGMEDLYQGGVMAPQNELK